MTLPNSGNISILDIAAEYGLPLPVNFPSQLYGKPGVPASGPLSVTDFYGKSNLAWTPENGFAADNGLGRAATVTLTSTLDALWTFTLPYDVTANRSSGTSGKTVTFNLPMPPAGAAYQSFSVNGQAAGQSKDFLVELTADRGDV